MTAYAELAVITNFSFLRGAAHPREMVETADALGLKAVGIADRNSFAGVVRAYEKWKKIRDQKSAEAGKSKEEIAKKHLVKLLVGTRLVTTDGFEAITYPTDRKAYGRLCRLITQGNKLLDGKKGECLLSFEDILTASEGQIFVAIPPDGMSATFEARLATLAHTASGRCFLAGCYRYHGDESRRLGLLNELGAHLGAPMVAVNDVHYHVPKRRALADVLTCIREKCTVQEAGFRLARNAERHLKTAEEMARLFADYPEAIARTIEIVNACHFDLGKLQNEYPDEPVPPGKTPQQHLEDMTWAGAKRRYPDGIPKKVVTRVKEEFAIIAKLDFARYFLTVQDVVAHARSISILCQGRGSAANSAVCYCLGITEINPETSQSLFARFVSENRGEPPDIDVDFEHERREEVIQYVYSRYGRERAAICATVVHYRSRRAIREVGKALGLTPDITAAIAKTVWGSHDDGLPDQHIRQAGLDAGNPAIRQTILLARQLLGFPRHLSQHVGGFVLTRERLDETVPIGNGAMKDRTFIEWDKDDIDTLGLMKVDVLALGMLSCLRRSLDLLKLHYSKEYTLDTLPKEDRKTYDMLSRADSVGVFQVESRAQMSMLPRLKPATFYDLVIEVAIVRPGPIQGNMVHPYLRQRERDPETIEYPHPSPEHGDKDELKNVLKRTLGVPLFQEQAMQIAITAAKFTPDEADGLRRAMATFRHTGNVPLFREKFVNRMVARGYDPKFVENCFGQIEGFGEYGFPESHAASFALLVYASAWIKCHYPDVFCAAILNSQPMGFYQPAQLVRDAREHDVEVREADVNCSEWDCTLEPAQEGSRHCYAVRLGFRQIQGLQKEELDRLINARGNGYASIERLAAVAGISRFTIERLAAADAFRSLDLDRRKALWVARRLDAIGLRTGKMPKPSSTKPDSRLPLLAPHMSDDLFPEPKVALTAMPLSEHVAEDYVATGLSLKEHPIRFFRDELARLGAIRNVDHRKDDLPQNSLVTIAGLVLMRQMPGTAKGVVFATLEDETGIANIVIWPQVFARNRRVVMTSRFLAVRGRLQRAGLVVHVVAEEFVDLTSQLCRLRDGGIALPDARMLSSKQGELPLIKSRDFH
ncbi:MAG: error-prone DNA polymerase [Pseudorhodoplanes sp.]|jgi:error-prone DNA polymerase|nr:error-prone DNA polymerase [Pseudorhodoplanes sp.]